MTLNLTGRCPHRDSIQKLYSLEVLKKAGWAYDTRGRNAAQNAGKLNYRTGRGMWGCSVFGMSVITTGIFWTVGMKYGIRRISAVISEGLYVESTKCLRLKHG